MIIKNAELPPAKNSSKPRATIDGRKNYTRPKLQIPFNDLAPGDAFQIDLMSDECDMSYNLIRQRCLRASMGKDGKVFVSRKSGRFVNIHRAA